MSAGYLARWRDDISSYISRDQVAPLVVRGQTMIPPVSRVRMSAFIDAAGGSGADSMTAALAFHAGEEEWG